MPASTKGKGGAKRCKAAQIRANPCLFSAPSCDAPAPASSRTSTSRQPPARHEVTRCNSDRRHTTLAPPPRTPGPSAPSIRPRSLGVIEAGRGWAGARRAPGGWGAGASVTRRAIEAPGGRGAPSAGGLGGARGPRSHDVQSRRAPAGPGRAERRGDWGARSGSSVTRRAIEACPGWAGARRALGGLGGALGVLGHTTCNRGVPRLGRGAPSAGGLGGPARGPRSHDVQSRRAPAGPGRAERRGAWGARSGPPWPGRAERRGAVNQSKRIG